MQQPRSWRRGTQTSKVLFEHRPSVGQHRLEVMFWFHLLRLEFLCQSHLERGHAASPVSLLKWVCLLADLINKLFQWFRGTPSVLLKMYKSVCVVCVVCVWCAWNQVICSSSRDKLGGIMLPKSSLLHSCGPAKDWFHLRLMNQTEARTTLTAGDPPAALGMQAPNSILVELLPSWLSLYGVLWNKPDIKWLHVWHLSVFWAYQIWV